MDIICAKCGKHFSSAESAREHRGHCNETKGGNEPNFIHTKNAKLSFEEQERILNSIRRSGLKNNEPKSESTNAQRIQVTSNSKTEQVSITNTGIEIRHEGKPTTGSANIPGHVYLNIDCSASMYGYKLQQAKKGAHNFAKDALTKNYLTGIIKFDSSATLIFEPCNDLSLIETRLNTLEVGKTTNMKDAIYLSCNLLKGLSGPKVIVIVTDGMPNSPGDPLSSLNAGDFAKSQQIDIIAIGTDDADHTFLKKIASRSELGIKVSSEKLEQSITSSVKLLPGNRMPEIKS
jgi:Mg-chelatase subunit ChlD